MDTLFVFRNCFGVGVCVGGGGGIFMKCTQSINQFIQYMLHIIHTKKNIIWVHIQV